jgi:hypothetical protein
MKMIESLIRDIAHNAFLDALSVLVFLLAEDGLLGSEALLAMLSLYVDLERMLESEVSTFYFEEWAK